MGASPEASTTGPGVSVLPCEPPCTAVALAVSFCDLEEGALSSRDVSLGFAGLGENPALVMVKQWRRPAAAAICAGCPEGSSSPE